MPAVWRRGDATYPPSLEDLPIPPEQLYVLGDPATLNAPRVAIVGTRAPTDYGLRITRAIAGELARAGACVISGMARGVGAKAHRSGGAGGTDARAPRRALEAGGRTVAVMGTGIDVPYPVGHRELHEKLSESGLVVSEYGSGFRAHKGAFPRRNRIIAALAPLTIVIEAGHRSGALNTADHALNLGRTVAAVPGPIDSPQSIGSNGLIRDGATPIFDIADVLALAGVSAPLRSRDVELEEPEARVMEALGNGGLDPDELSNRANLPARECLVAVSSLEILGLVECLLTGEVRRR